MIHNIVLGNSTKSRRTKDVDVEPDSSGDERAGARAAGGGDGADESSSEVEATDLEFSGDSGSEIGSEHEQDGEPQQTAAPLLVPSQVTVKKKHSSAAGAKTGVNVLCK